MSTAVSTVTVTSTSLFTSRRLVFTTVTTVDPSAVSTSYVGETNAAGVVTAYSTKRITGVTGTSTGLGTETTTLTSLIESVSTIFSSLPSSTSSTSTSSSSSSAPAPSSSTFSTSSSTSSSPSSSSSTSTSTTSTTVTSLTTLPSSTSRAVITGAGTTVTSTTTVAPVSTLSKASSTTTTPGSHVSSTPTEAIIGGAVGGVVLIFLLVILIRFCLIRKNRKRDDDAVSNADYRNHNNTNGVGGDGHGGEKDMWDPAGGAVAGRRASMYRSSTPVQSWAREQQRRSMSRREAAEAAAVLGAAGVGAAAAGNRRRPSQANQPSSAPPRRPSNNIAQTGPRRPSNSIAPNGPDGNARQHSARITPAMEQQAYYSRVPPPPHDNMAGVGSSIGRVPSAAATGGTTMSEQEHDAAYGGLMEDAAGMPPSDAREGPYAAAGAGVGAAAMSGQQKRHSGGNYPNVVRPGGQQQQGVNRGPSMGRDQWAQQQAPPQQQQYGQQAHGQQQQYGSQPQYGGQQQQYGRPHMWSQQPAEIIYRQPSPPLLAPSARRFDQDGEPAQGGWSSPAPSHQSEPALRSFPSDTREGGALRVMNETDETESVDERFGGLQQDAYSGLMQGLRSSVGPQDASSRGRPS